MPRIGLVSRLFCISAIVASVLSFSGSPALAADEYKWKSVPLPTEGRAGGWGLAWGSELRHLTAAPDGTLYCYATVSDTTDTLFKSTDGGVTWTSTGVKDAIIDISISPSKPATVYYATNSRVYRSSDTGATFTVLPPNPGGAGSGNVSITSLDVAAGANLVAVSTADADAGQFGGIYLIDESSPLSLWQNTMAGNYDYFRVSFSPGYASDRLLAAIGTNEVDTVVRHRVTGTAWSQVYGDARIPGIAPVTVDTSFPADYVTSGSLAIGVNTGAGRGGVYRIDRMSTPANSTAGSLHAGAAEGLATVDIASLIVTGSTASGTIIAGCSSSARVYISRDGGQSWVASQKPPTGQTQTYLADDPRDPGHSRMYAVTCGAESAFSFSEDGGTSWQQASFIDTRIQGLTSMAAVPASASDPVLFLVTINTGGKDSLWRTRDGGTHWTRVFSAALPGVDSFNLVQVDSSGASLFVAGRGGGNPLLWYSPDLGRTFSARPAPCTIDAMAIPDASTLIVGGVSAGKMVVCRSNNKGAFYTAIAETGVMVCSIVASPDFARDGAVYIGTTVGTVIKWNVAGAILTQIGQTLPVSGGAGVIRLAVDSAGRLYAVDYNAVTTSSKDRLFRLDTGQNPPSWVNMYTSFPVGATLNGVAVGAESVLYAVDGLGVAAADGKGGMLRVFGAASSSPSFSVLSGGLTEGTTLRGPWVCGNQVWCIDNHYLSLLTLTDTAAGPLKLVSPPDGAAVAGAEAMLDWQELAGATQYEWQLDDGLDFTALPSTRTGTTSATSVRVSGLAPGPAYYWRVRVIAPHSGPWSATRTFRTSTASVTLAPVLVFPTPGASTRVKPVFQWEKVSGADRYEILIARDTGFSMPVIDLSGNSAPATNAWESDRDLEYGTSYFWKVRARSGASIGEWSAVSVFITEAAPLPSETVPLPTTQPTQPVQSGQPTPSQTTDSIITLPTFSMTPQQITVITQPASAQAPAVTQLPPVANIQLVLPTWAIVAGLLLALCMVGLMAVLVVVLVKRRP